ncbi:MAG: NAD(P)H-dependent oxidoreductase [Propionibacteriaceae bacterium]|jgi:NAD(P)H dehydrogenase (quinone)|nr:NAD(P)H-dependent oxidoreductase [Propionibacteriaceae bacterium]
MRVHIVYAHPTHTSFTGAILAEFTRGLADAGHEHTLSDLYAMGFDPVLDADQYARESAWARDAPVPPVVAAEQAKLDAAAVWAFVYPVWWCDCPAILKGWFDRVWSAGWAYAHAPGTAAAVRVARKALVLCTAGHTTAQLKDTGCYQAMATSMLDDRLGTRAVERQFVVFGGTTDLTGAERETERQTQLAAAYREGRSLRA